ncbi:MAG: glycosyl hydrolase family 18 protein [Ginsengibacter sp.]
MKMKSAISVLLLSFFSTIVLCQKKNKNSSPSFKVVGYYFLNSALRDTTHADSTYQFLNKITHLNIAFINPDSTGNFNQHLAIDTLIKKAHLKKVKVLASIAGGGSHPYYAALLQDSNRKMFINNLVSLTQRYHLDGIDVDLEGNEIDNNYQKFIVGLAAALRPIHKLITAAIATAYKDQISNKALKQFAFINIMSYDRTGPWRPQDAGDPSPYSMAVEDLDYWHNIRSIPKKKLILGLPFYGYGFGPAGSPAISMDYKQIISSFPDAETSDTLLLPGNRVMYYNNISTIKKKTRLAMREAGGVMIWQLLGDTEGAQSLLSAIDEVIHEK